MILKANCLTKSSSICEGKKFSAPKLNAFFKFEIPFFIDAFFLFLGIEFGTLRWGFSIRKELILAFSSMALFWFLFSERRYWIDISVLSWLFKSLI